MKRYILKFIVLISLLLMVQSNGYAQSSTQDAVLTEEEKAWIEDHPVLMSTNEMEWAPLDFTRDGKAMGFSVDYLNLVADKVGLKIEYVNGYAWDILLEMLEKREIDIAQSIIMTPGREKYLDFTAPYLDLPMVYFGREGAERINGLADLEGKKLVSSRRLFPRPFTKRTFLILISLSLTVHFRL